MPLKKESSVCSRRAARHVQSRELGVESLVCLVLLVVQLGRRLWECLVVTRWGSSRMHISGYLVSDSVLDQKQELDNDESGRIRQDICGE